MVVMVTGCDLKTNAIVQLCVCVCVCACVLEKKSPDIYTELRKESVCACAYVQVNICV